MVRQMAPVAEEPDHARPDDHVLYLAFESGHECLRLLLPYAPDIAATTALSAPISTGDAAGVRLLLDAGADPNHLLDADLFGESHEQEPPEELETGLDRAEEQGWRYSDPGWVCTHRRRQASRYWLPL
jgi:hypothetical protein